MTWAQKATRQAEQEKQRQLLEQEEAERQQRESETQAEALATRLSPMITKLLEEAGDALFGRGGLLNARKYTIKRRGVVWQLEPTQGLTTYTSISAGETNLQDRFKSVDSFCISVTLAAAPNHPAQHYFRVQGYQNRDVSSRHSGRHHLAGCSVPEPTHETSDLSEAGLIIELQKFIYSYQKEMIRLKDISD